MSNLCYHNTQGVCREKDIKERGANRLESSQVLINKYPWLDIGDDKHTLIDLLPVGWHVLVLDLCVELRNALPPCLVDKYKVAEAKEKYYMLRWYDYIDDFGEMPEDIVDIVCKYEEKSRGVCMICGAPKPKDQPFCGACMELHNI